ncbi:MAG: hypothetical protein R2878_10335 [Thermoleophilia bacterium]
MPPARTPRRVAVVAVPGVGDDQPGDVGTAITDALAACADVHIAADRHDLLTPQPGGSDQMYRSPWFRMRIDGDDAPLVDVYEMRWADLSRFPHRFIGALLGVYGLILQLPTLALEAIKPTWNTSERVMVDDESSATPPHPTAGRLARSTLESFGWWLAVPVLLIAYTAAVLVGITGVTALLTQRTSAPDELLVAVQLLLAASGTGVAWWIGARVRDQGYGRVDPGSRPRSLGDRILESAADPRIAALVVFIGFGVVPYLVELQRDETSPLAAVANALAWNVVVPFRVSWVALSVLSALALLSLLYLWRRETWVGRRPAVHTALLTIFLAPVGMGLVNTLTVGTVGVLARIAAGSIQVGEVSGLRCVREDLDGWGLRACEAADTATNMRTSLGAWGETVFTYPLVGFVQAGVVVLALLALAVLVVTAQQSSGTPSFEGTALTRILAAINGRAATGFLAVGVALGTVIAVVWGSGFWSPDTLWPVAGERDSRWMILAVIGLVGLFGLDRALPMAVPGLGVVRSATVKGLDLALDVASWRRRSFPGAPPSPKQRITARFAGLLGEIERGGRERIPYDRLIIVAHSQGNVITAGTLFGDPFGEPAWRPSGDLPIGLVSLASPLLQSYEARLPGRYDWVCNPYERTQNPSFAPVTLGWVNLYRARDYVGRALWHRTGEDGVWDPAVTQQDRDRPEHPVRTERCIGLGDGVRWHTGYWGDPEVATVVFDRIRSAG